MNIVLNEYDWAEQAISRQSLGTNPIETLHRVAGYYLMNQYSKAETRRQLDMFLLQCDPAFPLARWSDVLDRIVKGASKRSLMRIDHISISQGELETIQSLDGKQLQRLAFTLLCLAKYQDAGSDNNHHWVHVSDKDIMRMANISASIKRQSALFAALRNRGLLCFSKRIDSLAVQVLFIDDTKPVIHITDFRNLGYQYLKYCGGPYFECTNCGLTGKLRNPDRGRTQKYCDSCAIEVHTKQKIDSVMRRRAPE